LVLRLIETGGTICMVDGPGGLTPARGIVGAAIARLAPGIAVAAEAFEPLIDSAEAGPVLWNGLLDRIEAAAGPVIVTHGTDTMAYTGAALDAALSGTSRTVILCGAMQPLGQPGGKAEANLALALDAATRQEPGVWLAFSGRLMPAGRLTKTETTGPDAFGLAGEDHTPMPPPSRRFDPDQNVAVLTVTPGLGAPSLEAMLAPLDGAVLRVFGAGTLPATLAQPLAGAVARGCRIVAVSQSTRGGLTPGAYAAGSGLWAAGVENGGAMSVEQALTRLWLRLSAAPRR
jgi:L-asparaginase